MSDIYVFGPNESENDYSTFGLAGALVPTKCEFQETANGESIITMEHPLDDFERYKLLQRGYILMVPVPVRTTPAFTEDGVVVTKVWTYKVKPLSQIDKDSKRTLYKKKTGSGRIKVLDAGTQVTVIDKPSGAERWLVKSDYGEGWIDISSDAPPGFTLEEEIVIDNNSKKIEEIQPAWKVRNQLFRIYEVTKSMDQIEVSARHISYDLLYNMTSSYVSASWNCQDRIDNIIYNLYDRPAGWDDLPFHGYSDSANEVAGLDYREKTVIDAFLDPEEGICAKYDVNLVRDNYSLYFLHDPGINRGVKIEYAKNMTGVEFKTSNDSYVTRIIPIGEDKDGENLYLADKVKVTHGNYEYYDLYAQNSVDPSVFAVDSPHINDYPVIHVKELTVDDAKVKDIEGNHTAAEKIEIARERMRQAAEDQFTEDEVDEIEVEMSVEYANLGDTEEYQQFKELENCFLYDYVQIVHPPLGIDVTARVTQITWDCLVDRMTEMQIGEVGDNLSDVGITTWQIPSGINGSKIANQTIDGSAIKNLSIQYAKISAAAIGSLTTEALTAVTANIDTLFANNVQASTLSAKIADIQNASINAAKINWATIDEATITSATIAKLKAKFAYLQTADINTAFINNATIDWANITNLKSQYAHITNGTIDNANINVANVNNLSANYAHITNGVIDNAKISYADVNNLSAHYAHITSGVIDNATINVANVNNLSANYAHITNGVIDTATIGWADINGLTAGTALIRQGVGGKLFIDDLAVAKAVISELTIGTLLMRDASTGLMKRFVLDSSETSGYKVADADQVVAGDNIVANTITAQQLNVGAIFADSALVNAIKAVNIDVSNLFAASATIGQLDSYLQRAATISAIKGMLNLEANESIAMYVSKNIQTGGTNLIRKTKAPSFGTGKDDWRRTSADTCEAYYSSPNDGFKRLRIHATGLESTAWNTISSPYAQLPLNWLDRTVTLSFDYAAMNWANVDHNVGVILYFHNSSDNTTAHRIAKFNLIVPGQAQWGSDAVGYSGNPSNGHFRRVWMNFTLSSANLSQGDASTFGNCTHVYVAFQLGKNGDIRIRAPRLEWGNLASDWSPAPEDIVSESNSVVETLFTVTNGAITGLVSNTFLDQMGNTVSQTSTLISQTTDTITQAVFGQQAAGHSLGDALVTMNSGITVNQNGITLEASKVVSSEQLLPRTRKLPFAITDISSTYSDSTKIPSGMATSAVSFWARNNTTAVTRYSNSKPFYRVQLSTSGQSSDTWYSVYSPIIELDDGWYERNITLTMLISATDYSLVDRGVVASITLQNHGNSRDQTNNYIGFKRLVGNATTEWPTGVMHENGKSLVSGKWRKVAVTFNLSATDIDTVRGTPEASLSASTHMFVAIGLVRNGTVQITKPMLGWGEKMADWAEYRDDISEATSASIKILDDSIVSKVEGALGWSTVTQTISDITSEVFDEEGGRVSRVVQEAEEISQWVQGADDDITSLKQDSKHISLSVKGNVGRQLILNTDDPILKTSNTEGTTASDWRKSNYDGIVVYDGTYGRKRFRINVTDKTSDTWYGIYSPVIPISKQSWVGNKLALSMWVWSPSWESIDGSSGMWLNLNLASSRSMTRTCYQSIYNVNAPGTHNWASTNIIPDKNSSGNDIALANSQWRHFTVIFEMDSSKFSGTTENFEANTHMWIGFGLRRNGDVRVYHPKLEWGDMSTDWSPAPEESGGLYTGQEGVEVNINKDSFIVDVPGTLGDLSLDPQGAKMGALTITDNIEAPNIAPIYSGPSTITVVGPGSSTPVSASTVKTISDAFSKLNGRWLGKSVTISLAAGTNISDAGKTVTLYGICGPGNINIDGDTNSHAKMTGRINVNNCFNQIQIRYLDITNSGSAIVVSNCPYVRVNNCILRGNNSSNTYGVAVQNHASVTVSDCQAYDFSRSFNLNDGDKMALARNKGNCRIAVQYGLAYVSGTQPCDQVNPWVGNTSNGGQIFGTATTDQGTSPTGTVEVITSTEATAEYTDSYGARSWTFLGKELAQGITTGSGDPIEGCIWFPSSLLTTLSGKTIKSASLRLTQRKGYGRRKSVSVEMYGTDTTHPASATGHPSGNPPETTTYGTIGYTTPGEPVEMSIPVTAITDLVAGTIKALMLKSNDTTLFKGAVYSSNYARFYGAHDDDSDVSNKPRLTVYYVS